MADQQSQQRQQPTSYPSPSAHSYPSPSMQPTYAYPPQGQAPHEQYRGSPQVPNMSLPPLNLPPIRLQDGQTQPSQQQQGQQMGSPHPPPQHAMNQYYPHPGHAQQGPPMNMNSAQHLATMRYQLPPQGESGQRILSGGRHKKEIKRRTKTGCLTCRKRRIKVSALFNCAAMRCEERDLAARGEVLASSRQRLQPVTEPPRSEIQTISIV
jgi:hypothetical protein